MAVHSDTWLLAVAFYHGARLNREGRCGSLTAGTSHPAIPLVAWHNMDSRCRERLFELINTEPTCYEIVIGKAAGSAPVKPKRSTSLYSDPAPATRQPPRPSRPVRASWFSQAASLPGLTAQRTTCWSAQAPGRRQRSPDDNDEGLDSDEDDEGNDDQYADGEGDPCPNCGRVYRCGAWSIASFPPSPAWLRSSGR